MRTKNSIINILASIGAQAITILLGFITQKVFINSLGTEVLGINGLFSNIISMLAIAELGISTAVIYNLYKPVAENDKEKIKKYMNFYKICYRIILLIITFLGLVIFPFIKYFVGNVTITYNIYIIYTLFLFDTIASYTLTYKRSILYADQKNYIINIIHICYLILLNVGQIFLLIRFKNYIAYLILKIIMRLLENIIINIYVMRKYEYLKEHVNEKLSKEEKGHFFRELKGLIFHKISWTVISGTDNIIISKFVGIISVGIYSNYTMITNTLEQFMAQIFSAMTGSVGNLLALESKEKAYEIYKRTEMLQFIIYSTVTIGIFVVSKPFIEVWLGNKEFILDDLTVFTLSLSFFISGMRRNICIFKDASGIFYKDRFYSLGAAFINIIFSIILVKFYGIKGVIIGTIICYLFLHIVSYPKNIYETIFGRKKIEYIIEFIKYNCLVIFYMLITVVVVKYTIINNKILELIKDAVLAVIIPNIITVSIFRKKEEMSYLKQLIFNIIKNKMEEKKQ